jgi:DNA-binding MarR family transcriptional regulator
MELVERRAHPTDRRIRLLHLTAKAHPLLGEIFSIGAATRGEALEGVAEADRDHLFAILASMKANLLSKAATGASGERRASHG